MNNHEIKLSVPDEIWDRWAQEARDAGKSVRAYVHSLLNLPEPPRAGNPNGLNHLSAEELTAARNKGADARRKAIPAQDKDAANEPSAIKQLADALRQLQEDGEDDGIQDTAK